ncbi:MAG: FAD:protein FMN transferase [Acidobacteriota bacterium]|nr:FAD:protein FMN transferase [Acidobacteriota bacterium]
MQTLQRREFLNFTPDHRVPSEGFWLHVSRPAMACRFEVTLPLRERAGVAAAQAALDEVDSLEQQLTIFRESSEVSFINRNAASVAVEVEASLFELLLVCQQLHRETEGAFDITSNPLSRCWGFLKREGRVPFESEIEEAISCSGSDKLVLNRESQTIRFERRDVEINFGSIGKGYALDRVAAHVRRRVRSALLSAGYSSMHAVGSGDAAGHKGWMVGVRHPRHKEKRMAVLRLRDCAMSTSGSEEQCFEHQGRLYGHIIDPRTGYPSEGVSCVTVIARAAAVSDALATAFYVGGPELAERYCASHPGVMAVMLESGAMSPVVFGSSDKCEVEVVNE